MATVIAVHGTFAHSTAVDGASVSLAPEQLQWWQPGSTFDRELRDMVAAVPGMGSGTLSVVPFEWSGENSEIARRDAGKKLYGELAALDAKGEPYCVIGHSHGGSVINWALLEAAARKQRLDGLQRWITVGTPFVSMKREPLLFQRLDLSRKVVFVASMMLILMFLVYIGAELLSGRRMLFGAMFPAVLVVTGVMMSLPVIVFYALLKYLDGRSLLHYRKRVRERAESAFAKRWLSLTHTDDEAVQGLAFLPGAKLSFFDKHFAVSAITTISVFAVPLLYLAILTSPTLMLGIGDWLKSGVYDSQPHIEAEEALRSAREQLRAARRDRSGIGGAAIDRRALWREFREMRERLAERYPDLRAAERSLRFKQRFFEQDGVPCEGGRLCGAGRDLRINSGLLLHLVTDELSSAIGGEESENRSRQKIMELLISAVVVPLIFGALALALMLLIRTLAHGISTATSHALNSITNAEVKRAAFGNDTEGEIAMGAVDRPTWISESPPRLPSGLSALVTDYSNGIATKSLAKFRSAIGQLASAEPKHTADSAITTYFTWKELVHASYFDVPEFRKVVAVSLSRCTGFGATPGFERDADYRRAAQWLSEIEGAPGTPAPPAAAPPSDEDKAAVAAVIASTVKQEP
jgi:hypothetical protein